MRDILFCSVSFTICALIFILAALFLLLYKSNKNNKISKLYYYTTYFTLFLIILELCLPFSIKNREAYPILNEIICRLYSFSTIEWSLFLIYQMFSYNKNIRLKPYNIIVGIYSVVFLILCIYLPLEFNSTRFYTLTGPLAYLMHIVCLTMSLIELSFITFKVVEIKKLLKEPLYIGTFSYLIIVFYQFISGNFFNILSFMFSLIIIDFYFSAENQDDKLLMEYEKQKQISEKVNSEKEKFLSNMSKEIRTPMSNIMGLSDLIMINKDNITLEELNENGKIIHNESIGLLNTINNILDLARFEANKEEEINMNYLFEDFALEIDDYIKKNNLNVKYTFNKELPNNLYGDISKIKKIVELKIEEENRKSKISKIEIKYTYSAIVDEYLCGLINITFIYDGMVDNSSADLELEETIIENCCRLVKATYEEEISNFKKIFKLKYYHKIIDNKVISDINEKINIKNNNNNIIEDYSNKKILIVDDSQMNINIMKRLFSKYNFVLDDALSGEKCLELCKENNYDLILLDDMMPGLSGVDTLKELKRRNINSVVIALTANMGDGLKEKYINGGFDDYISKPVDMVKLNRLLKKYLGKGGDNNAL